MKPTLFLSVFALAALRAAAVDNPVNTPIGRSAPATTESNTPVPGKKSTDGTVSYAAADRSLAELNRGVRELSDCVTAYEYLASSASKAEKKYTGADGTVPSHLAALIPMKRKMADDKRMACISQGNALGNQFSAVRSDFAEFEPRNAKGLPARRLELTEMRGKANGLMGRLGAKPAKPSNAPKPTKASEADDGGESSSEE